MRRLCACLTLIISVFVAAGAIGQPQVSSRTLSEASDDWKQTFSAVEAYLRSDEKSAQLQASYAQRLEAVVNEAQLFREAAGQELAARQRLLDSLGPPPAEGQPPEDREIGRQRSELNQAIAGFRARLALADFALARADALREQLSQAYRADFRSRILARQPVMFTWEAFEKGFADIASLLATMAKAPVFAYEALSADQRHDLWFGWGTLAILATVVAAWPIRLWLLRRFGPSPELTSPTYARRLLAAIVVAVANGLIPSIVLAAIYLRIATDLHLNTGLAADVTRQVSLAVLFLIVTVALARAALSPDYPTWRLTRLTAKSARRLNRTIIFLATVFVIDQALTRISASLNPSEEAVMVWIRGIGLIEALGLVLLTRASLWQSDRMTDGATESSGDRDGIPNTGEQPLRESRWGKIFRNGVAAAAIGSVLARTLGYFALGHFITQGLLKSSVVLAALYLLKRLSEEVIAVLARTRLESGHVVLSDQDRPNLRFWLDLAISALIYGLAVYALLIIWGVPNEDIDHSLADAFGGFAIGGVKISPADIGVAILVLFGGIFIAGRLRRVLDRQILPRTNLDVGVRNSLATAAGYVGVVMAAVVAVAVAGFDVSNLAIVAGALSVGIGFGLQNIVNNFVSGLILLAERPVKVGDWVVVGDKQGYVKKISVRATEILTFDRSSVILPNSELLSTSVVNLTHKDKSGRVDIRVGVAYGTDPERVRETLLGCANAHPEIVSWPKPFVVFADFGASSLDFALYAYLSDVEKRLTVASDLRFAIDKAFRDSGIEIPFTQTDIHFRDLDDLAATLRSALAPAAVPDEPSPPSAQPAAQAETSPSPASPPAAARSGELPAVPSESDKPEFLKRGRRSPLDSI